MPFLRFTLKNLKPLEDTLPFLGSLLCVRVCVGMCKRVSARMYWYGCIAQRRPKDGRGHTNARERDTLLAFLDPSAFLDLFHHTSLVVLTCALFVFILHHSCVATISIHISAWGEVSDEEEA